MKFLIALCFVALVGSSLAELETDLTDHIHGTRYRQCEKGTHAYSTGCGYITPEATCDNHNPEPDTSAKICDYTACYCDPPTVRDTTTNKCVPLEECAWYIKKVHDIMYGVLKMK